MSLEVITPPAVEPLTLEEAKNFLRVDITADDALIARLTTAASLFCEQLGERAFCTQTLRHSQDAFPTCGSFRQLAIDLPRPKLQSVTSVVYVDADGVSQTLDAADYVVDARREPGQVMPAYGLAWPATRQVPNAVGITYVAGYGLAASVDARAKQAVCLVLGHWYDNRTTVLTGTISKEVEVAAKSLLNQLWHGKLW